MLPKLFNAFYVLEFLVVKFFREKNLTIKRNRSISPPPQSEPLFLSISSLRTNCRDENRVTESKPSTKNLNYFPNKLASM